ncbi:MAG TPA: M14 metallopeptidase family protein [Bacteroidales bacterium]|nr:M14 metallopeptidase family protein [Bacteroidales bacterium]
MKRLSAVLTAAILLYCIAYSQEKKIPSPKEHFGFNIGDDYMLATYTQTEAYFRMLASSPRVRLEDIGMTEEGRHQYMLIISSPGNIISLEKYRAISEKLARAENITDDEAKRLSEEGKAVVWIDGGLHATEVVGTHQLIEMAWQLVSRDDRETMEILDKVIVLLTHANPDGQELVSSWYMRNQDPVKRKMNIPRLYQKYIGHDNNRDFYMMSMKETRNMSRQLYIRWFPQILYNHHQSGPAGSVLAGPPYRDPFNYLYDPLVVSGIDAVGAAMNNRLNSEGKPGYTQRSGSSFSTWYNGGLRTTAYFHNIIGLLTEIIGSPTPINIPFVPERLLPNGATPNPVTPQEWHFRQSIDYSVSLNYAVLDYAARNHDELLYNIYRMGKNSVSRGSSDNWTITPSKIEAIKNLWYPSADSSRKLVLHQNGQFYSKFNEVIARDPDSRDPRAYIIPSDQEDFPTAVRFVNALILSGIKVMKAGTTFKISAREYPRGSYIIMTGQAFRPHIMDMFEPQDHPNDLLYPGGPPVPPYDAAGWTLALQMGVKFDRIRDSFSGNFEVIPYGEEQSPAIHQAIPASHNGYLLDPSVINSFKVANDLLKEDIPVFRVIADRREKTVKPGTFFIPWSEKAMRILSGSADSAGVFVRTASRKPGTIVRVAPLRIGLTDRYGGSMAAGWIKWILEQYGFRYRVIYPQNIDSGNIGKTCDIIILASDVAPRLRRISDTLSSPPPFTTATDDIPAEYKGTTGSISSTKSLPQLKKFMEAGGTVLTIGPSSNLAMSLELPVSSALVRKNDDGSGTELKNTEFYIPGSLLYTSIDSSSAGTWGMPTGCCIYFEQDPVFRLGENAASKGIHSLLWYSGEKPLRSGWALGQKYLKDGVAGFEAPVGRGHFVGFGPEITFRSQSQAAFKLLFNQLYGSGEKK